MEYLLLVPVGYLSDVILPGSAVVGAGDVAEDGSWLMNVSGEFSHHSRIYYEGNMYGSTSLESLEDKAFIATSRLLQRAPTIAFAVVSQEMCVPVAKWNHDHMAIDWINKDLFDRWASGEKIVPITQVARCTFA